MRIGCKKYAERLLKKTDCFLDCYKGTDLETIISDLRSYYAENPKELDYPVEDVATCLREIGDEQPDPPKKGHKKFKMIYDGDSFIDGIEFDDFDAAKADALETLILWMQEECRAWKLNEDGNPAPTQEQIDSWDYMIYNCGVYVVEWDESIHDYEDIDDAWCPTDDDCREIGWMLWEEFNAET